MELGQHATDSQDWRPRQLKWDAIERVGKDKQRAPTVREQAIMAALVELKLLSGPRVARRFMPDASERTVRNQLHAMCAQGWLRRAHLLCEGPGQTPRVFALDDGGWAQAKEYEHYGVGYDDSRSGSGTGNGGGEYDRDRSGEGTSVATSQAPPATTR